MYCMVSYNIILIIFKKIGLPTQCLIPSIKIRKKLFEYLRVLLWKNHYSLRKRHEVQLDFHYTTLRKVSYVIKNVLYEMTNVNNQWVETLPE